MANLVIQTAFLGDLLLAIPLLRRIKELDPDRPLWVLCRKGFAPLLESLKLVDKAIEIDKSKWFRPSPSLEILKNQNFHWVICPHQSVRTHLVVAGLKAELKIGFRQWWNAPFFHHRVVRPMRLPDALRQLSLLSAIDSVTAERVKSCEGQDWAQNPEGRDDVRLDRQGSIPDWAKMNVPLFQSPRARRALVAPGSVWPTKRWTESGFIELCHHLMAAGFEVVLIGSPDERPICERIHRACPGTVNAAGEWSLAGLLQEMSRSAIVISNDSGAMHMAAATDTPTVGIFGPTVLSLGYRPWMDQSWVVQQAQACRPCGLHGSRECPIGTHVCMKSISAERVFRAAETLTDPSH